MNSSTFYSIKKILTLNSTLKMEKIQLFLIHQKIIKFILLLKKKYLMHNTPLTLFKVNTLEIPPQKLKKSIEIV